MYKFTRSSYFWNHLSELDTLVNQNSHAAPIRSPVRGRTGFSKSRGLRASVTFFPLPHPAPSTFCSRPIFHAARMRKPLFARPEFRSHRWGMLATQANCRGQIELWQGSQSKCSDRTLPVPNIVALSLAHLKVKYQ